MPNVFVLGPGVFLGVTGIGFEAGVFLGVTGIGFDVGFGVFLGVVGIGFGVFLGVVGIGLEVGDRLNVEGCAGESSTHCIDDDAGVGDEHNSFNLSLLACRTAERGDCRTLFSSADSGLDIK